MKSGWFCLLSFLDDPFQNEPKQLLILAIIRPREQDYGPGVANQGLGVLILNRTKKYKNLKISIFLNFLSLLEDINAQIVLLDHPDLHPEALFGRKVHQTLFLC